MTDPLAKERVRNRVSALAALLGMCGALLFAFAPLPSRDALPAAAEDSVATPPPAPEDQAALDVAAFRAADWWPALGRNVEPEGDSRTDPVLESWTLVGIIQDGEGARAAVYAKDEDALFVLGKGDSRGGAEVVEVEAKEVLVREQGTLYRLALDPGPRNDKGSGGGP